MRKFLLLLILGATLSGAQALTPKTTEPVRVDNGWGMRIYGCLTGYKPWSGHFEGHPMKFIWIEVGKTWIDDGKTDPKCVPVNLDPNKDIIEGIDRP